jgi:hypothetical protein
VESIFESVDALHPDSICMHAHGMCDMSFRLLLAIRHIL